MLCLTNRNAWTNIYKFFNPPTVIFPINACMQYSPIVDPAKRFCNISPNIILANSLLRIQYNSCNHRSMEDFDTNLIPKYNIINYVGG